MSETTDAENRASAAYVEGSFSHFVKGYLLSALMLSPTLYKGCSYNAIKEENQQLKESLTIERIAVDTENGLAEVVNSAGATRYFQHNGLWYVPCAVELNQGETNGNSKTSYTRKIE